MVYPILDKTRWHRYLDDASNYCGIQPTSRLLHTFESNYVQVMTLVIIIIIIISILVTCRPILLLLLLLIMTDNTD